MIELWIKQLWNLYFICSTYDKPMVKFNYSQYLANTMHFELMEFNATRYFGFQSYLVYLFLYYQVVMFQHLWLKVEDELGNPCLII